MVIRRTLEESPCFQAVKARSAGRARPRRRRLRSTTVPLLLVFFMNVGVNAQSYTYQVFMAAYLTSLSASIPVRPKVLLVGALCGCLSAFLTGRLRCLWAQSPLHVRCRCARADARALVHRTGLGFDGRLVIVIVLGFIVWVDIGAVGVQMSCFFPEIFGGRLPLRRRTLGREFSSVVGGGLADLFGPPHVVQQVVEGPRGNIT